MNKKLLIAIIAAAVAVIIAVGAIVIVKLSKKDNSSEEKINPEDFESSEVDTIKIPGYPEIEIPANSTEVTVSIPNPEGNPCDFVFELILKDTDESLYKSEKVAPGSSLEKIKLSRSLEKGSYNAILRVTTTSVKDGTPMNGADIETVLKVR